MIRLSTLGGLHVDGLPANASDELLRQPKRLSVLVYLSVGAPRGRRSRDSLVEMFWSDRERTRALGALRNTLFHLRRLLGREAIRSLADGLLVDRERLWCDATSFSEAVAAGRHSEAVALYRGDLLPDFFLPGAPAFERWLESERAALRTAAETARRSAGEDTVATGRSGTSKPRIAVLPFEAHRSRPEEERLAAGLTHGVTSALSRLSSVRVIGRSTVGRYRGPARSPLERIVSELDVGAVVTGSVRSIEDGLLVLVKLIDAGTGRPIWADIRERGAGDAALLQGDVVVDLLNAMGTDVTDAERRRLESRPPRSIAAYEQYLEGRRALAGRGSRDLEMAAERFREAAALDPDFALAHAGLAEAYLLLYPAAGVRPAEARLLACDAARRALRIDPAHGEAHATLGLALAVLEGEYGEAESHLRRATEMAPGYSTAHHWYGALLSFLLRRFDEGERELALARDLDPRSGIIHVDSALARMNRGHRAEAFDAFRIALELEPDLWRVHHDLGITLVCSGRPEDGIRHLKRAWQAGAWGGDPTRSRPSVDGDWRSALEARLHEIETRPPRPGVATFESALLSALLGRRDESLEFLEAANSPAEWALVMQYRFAFESLEDDERLLRRLRSAGLA